MGRTLTDLAWYIVSETRMLKLLMNSISERAKRKTHMPTSTDTPIFILISRFLCLNRCLLFVFFVSEHFVKFFVIHEGVEGFAGGIKFLVAFDVV